MAGLERERERGVEEEDEVVRVEMFKQVDVTEICYVG